MDDIIELLNVYFKRVEDVEPEEACSDEMMIEGDWWEFQDPKAVKAWTLKMVPHTDNMHFNMKYKNSPVFLPILFDEKVKTITRDLCSGVKIQCVTTRNDLTPEQQYHFTTVLDSQKIDFNISPFLSSLESTPYVAELKQLEQKVDAGEYHNLDRTPLTGKWLVKKLGLLMNSFLIFIDKHDMERSFMAPRTVRILVRRKGNHLRDAKLMDHKVGVQRKESLL
jgi:hypothetical protein